jgi:hypothetical protein
MDKKLSIKDETSEFLLYTALGEVGISILENTTLSG